MYFINPQQVFDKAFTTPDATGDMFRLRVSKHAHVDQNTATKMVQGDAVRG